MFDIANRFINIFMMKNISFPLNSIMVMLLNIHIQYRNTHESLNSSFGRFIMPIVFLCVTAFMVCERAIKAIVCTLVLPLFFFAYYLPIGLLGERAAVLPWINYSTSIDGPNATDVDFCRGAFDVMHIELVDITFFGQKLFILRYIDVEEVYLAFTSEHDFSHFVFEMTMRQLDEEEVLR